MLYFTKWKAALVLLVCALGVIYAAPNFFPKGTFPTEASWMPGKQISLGLDLRGGSHMLLEVGVDSVIRERYDSLTENMRDALREQRLRYRGLRGSADGASVTIVNDDDVEKARSMLAKLDPLTIVGGEGNHIMLTYNEKTRREMIDRAISQSLEVVRRRVDELGTTEPSIQRQGEDRIVVQVPGLDDPSRLRDILGRTAKMNFHLINETKTPQQAKATGIPPGAVIMPGADNASPGEPEEYLVDRRVVVSGDNLIDSQPTFNDGRPVVSFRFDAAGGARFGDVTSKNTGRRLAIVLDGKVISAPRINEPIMGGSGIITGQFGVQEANDLSLLLRAGALPAPMKILEERSVGPGLGQDSIDSGEIAAILGMVFVVVFMAISYGLFGIFANLALIVNLVLILAIMSILQATLTLPGIAGIVLTVGMAVDANVLIFERIREERKIGRSIINSIDAGYRSAMSTILDANITTLIAALVLFSFGSGPIKGFAVTLAIGIITSMFAAIWVTRLIVAFWVKRRRPTELVL
ncbi:MULTISPECIES: protein translocase subunit SecD [unclassified Thalassospira]|jgi:preprotein translocase subunit SecD|uniref:protein translocase subunit SecD n=1 Tax=unclassified Thalassospira TaxID=2648997 RepID=UPI000A1DDE1D|nr:protein translocase subunit SecD [Thalassospira sp. MCCC 1A01428]OSQ41256.1 preprotein translocase subunit SecD [Thalassospira sp. MCCC 1A01428]